VKKRSASKSLLFLACGILAATTSAQNTTAIPNPVLAFQGQEEVLRQGKTLVKFKFAIENRNSIPNELFAESPDLPPCGTNTRSARTWIDVFDQRGKRLNGFCAVKNRDGLSDIWFMLEPGAVPPSWVYIQMNDRKEQRVYKSNLAETTL